MSKLRSRLNVIYDEFRTVKLNQSYYSERMRFVKGRLLRFDVFLALFAAGSGVLGFGLWSVELFGLQVGQIALGFLSGVAVILGIAKPYLKIDDELARLSSIQGSYDSIAHILEDIVTKIKSNHDFTEADEQVYEALRQIRGQLGPKEDKPADEGLARKIQKQINHRYPLEEFWYPDE